MYSKILIATLAATLLAMTSACESKRKMKMGHSLKGGNSKAGTTKNEGVKKFLTDTANKPCLQLKGFLDEAMASESNASKRFIIYIKSRIILSSGSATATDLGEQLGVLVAPLTSGLIEESTGSKLANSQLIGPYLNVLADSCEQVSFGEPGVAPADEDIFSVEKSVNSAPVPTPAPQKDKNGKIIRRAPTPQQLHPGANPTRLTLINKVGDTREYLIDDNSLRIEITQAAVPGVKACDGSTPHSVKVKTTYFMNFSEEESRLDISPTWAKALAGTLKSSDSLTASIAEFNARLTEAAKIQPRKEQNASQRKTAERSFNGGIPVTFLELWHLGQSIQKKEFKDVCPGDPKKTSVPVIPNSPKWQI